MDLHDIHGCRYTFSKFLFVCVFWRYGHFHRPESRFDIDSTSIGIEEIITQFHSSQEVVTLGLSLFVLGFALGPLLFAPMSELYGRQVLYFATFGALVCFNAGCAASQNIWSLIILRFFAGSFGSSPLANAGGIIADMFPAKERGLAMTIFAAAPFMGPVLGPIIGGFLGQYTGWVSYRISGGAVPRWLTCVYPAMGRRLYGHIFRRRLDRSLTDSS
jgi:multidrug resistance protein